MNTLEKILEEINSATDEYGMIDCINGKQMISREKVKEIVKKHLFDSDNEGWIPVKERLPEESGTYIVTAKSAGETVVTFVKWQNRYKKFELTGRRAYWRIIAWRPLPEPYHQKGNTGSRKRTYYE